MHLIEKAHRSAITGVDTRVTLSHNRAINQGVTLMRATDVMLVFLMLLVWGQNYQTHRDIDNMKNRTPRSAGCARVLPYRSAQ